MTTSKTKFVICTVDSDVFNVTLRELLNGLLDDLESTLLTHCLGGVVGVASGAVPVTLERLRVEGDLDAPLFGYTDKEVSGHPEVVTHRNALTRPDLELPLRRHDLRVDTGDIDTRIQAGAVMSLNQIASEDFASTYVND